MYTAELNFDGCYSVGNGSSPEAAIQSVIDERFTNCPNAGEPENPLTWTASGEYWAPLSSFGSVVGQVFDQSGAPLNVGTYQHAWVYPNPDQGYPGFTPGDIAMVFSWGFGAVVFFWFLGQCIGAAIGVIRRA